MWNLEEAVAYARLHAIDNEDFLDNDEINQERFLNVSSRTLTRAFKGLSIPDSAVYLFACVLNSFYNDTTAQQHRGVSSFTVDGIQFSFKNLNIDDLTKLITGDIRDLIAEENGGDDSGINGGRVKWVIV